MSGCSGVGDRATAPVPWIGFYIAFASLACCLLMILDLFFGVRKLPFRSRYFALNSATLALLGIATKLPADLTTSMPGRYDQLSKLSGTALLCTSIANFMPSLVDMSASEAISNTIAVAILVVTVVADVSIQMGTGVIGNLIPEHAVLLYLLLSLLLILNSAAVCASPTKELLCKYYDENCRLYDEYPIGSEVRDFLKFFWVTAQFYSPRYVFGYSETCTASGLFSLIAAGVLVEAAIRSTTVCTGQSDYRWSTRVVFFVQAVTVGVGTIAPACRWLTSVRFFPDFATQELRQGLFLLREWEDSPLPDPGLTGIWKFFMETCRLYFRAIRLSQHNSIMSTCYNIRFNSIRLGRTWWKKSRETDYSVSPMGYISLVKENLSRLPEDLKGWIQKGARSQPTHLVKFLEKHYSSTARNEPTTAGQLDRGGDELPLCWGLQIVTLATIAVSLPEIEKKLRVTLLNGVRQGLKHIMAVDDYHLKKKGHSNILRIRKATEKVWSELVLNNRWLEEDLRSIQHHENNGRSALERLKKSAQDNLNPVVLIQLSQRHMISEIEEMYGLELKDLVNIYMYKVSDTVLEEDPREERTSGELFARLQTMISDNMAACFTNLPSAIYNKCAYGPIEDREENVREAAVILGEVEDILKFLGIDTEQLHSQRRECVVGEWGSGRQDHISTSSNELFVSV